MLYNYVSKSNRLPTDGAELMMPGAGTSFVTVYTVVSVDVYTVVFLLQLLPHLLVLSG